MGTNMVEPEKPQMTTKYGACALHAREVKLYARVPMSMRPHTHTHTHTHTQRNM